jgi:Transcription factor WhiB
MSARTRQQHRHTTRIMGRGTRFSSAEQGIRVGTGDVRTMLAILAGDSVLTTHLKWQDDALCGEIGPEIFYLGQGSNSREARTVCAECPVRRPCLLDALEHMDDYGPGVHGIWGSTSHDQREYLLKLHGGDARGAAEYAMRCDPLDASPAPQPRQEAA